MCCLPAASLSAAPSAESEAQFRISTGSAGLYRVSFEALEKAGLVDIDLPSSQLALSTRGTEVPLCVRDGGDGRFGRGDVFEFLAARLEGAESYSHEYSRHNVYWLRFSHAGGVRMREVDALPGDTSGSNGAWRRRLHLEEDRQLIRLSAEDVGGVEEPELWFWQKLTHLDDRLHIPVQLPGIDASSKAPVRIGIDLRGLSSQTTWPPSEIKDHQVDVSFANRRLEPVRWDGRRQHVARFEPISAQRQARSEPSLSIKIPRRRPEGSEDPLVDVVMLNWVEVDYPHDGRVGATQIQLHPDAPQGATLGLSAEPGLEFSVYGTSGSRFVSTNASVVLTGDPEPEESFWAVPLGTERTPDHIELDRSSTLIDSEQQADYLIIAHGSLLESSRRLAEHHRAAGLEVALVDVQDVYDEFGHGIVHPSAIRDFIAHAYHRWQQPRPRYVLLVGDASWDTKNDTADDSRYANWVDRQLLQRGTFGAQRVETYDDALSPDDRNLIPTFTFHTNEGHAASDNWFVAVEDDDLLPDLAIGRLPIADSDVLDGLIAKILRYATDSKVGPWRRNVLWITNEWKWLQDHSRDIEEALRPRGLSASWVVPTSEEVTNEHHQAFLTEALDAGQLMVHFAGHGGRYIWRTGPRDLGSKNVDLFTLDHVEALAPNDRLPVVFSVTCHSGPFDHPSADSIAEAFLRLPDRGAIAVVAAAWRTSAASVWLSREMMTEFSLGGPIGDAFLRAKRNLDVDDLIATYNLLGDPALPLALPESAVTLNVLQEARRRTLVLIPEIAGFSGRALVDFVDAEGHLVHSQEVEVTSEQTELNWPQGFDQGLVRAYLWNEARNIDAIGTLMLEPASTPTVGR